MNILIVGGGGREHAMAFACAKSNETQRIYIAPGNGGTAQEPKCSNVAIAATDTAGLIAFAQQHAITLTIIGPEAPLSAGIVDAFTAAGLTCFGPCQAAAQLESSKQFCKSLLQAQGIPTAQYQSFSDVALALAYLETQTMPVVIKADGLAAGKGVVICHDQNTAKQTVKSMLCEAAFGKASQKIIIERFLRGQEASFIALVDGNTILAMASSQDHKARYDHDRGDNTGGMGAISPTPLVTAAMHQHILETIIQPTLAGLSARGIRYCGFLYAGLMISSDGQPQVLEYNCRLGDPEAQALLMRLDSDFTDYCLAAAQNRLHELPPLQFNPQTAVSVVMVSAGYPGKYEKGQVITGLDQPLPDGCKIFHSGTAHDQTGNIVTNGGRVLTVTALGDTVDDAQQRTYALLPAIHWPGVDYRQDIGHKALA